MKPKYEEAYRILNLAERCWFDFLNELNSPVFSKSHIPDEAFFEEAFRRTSSSEVREATFLVLWYWSRIAKSSFCMTLLGMKFSKPHAVFAETLIKARYEVSYKVVSKRVKTESSRRISEIETGIKSLDVDSKLPADHSQVLAYDNEMLLTRIYADPYVRAGSELWLLKRGFKL